MKILYFECEMGAAGDMLCGALFELLEDKEKENFLKQFNSLGIPGVKLHAEPSVKCGIIGTGIRMLINGEEEDEHLHDYEHHDHDHHDHDHHDHDHHDHDHHDHDHHDHDHGHHHHTSLHDIGHIAEGLPLSDGVKNNILSVYRRIAEAEANVHNTRIDQIHFHEVGTMDAVADVTAFCMLMDILSPDKVVVSPVHVGSGTVKCAHGVLPVPAPATVYLLKGVPMSSGKVKGELCTPTGAALLTHFADQFGEMPPIRTEKIGYGMGKKDFEQANCVRAFIGEGADEEEEVSELSLNVDDMTGEEIAFACEMLFEAGALEVYTIPIGMKKGRPGTLIRVLCREDKKDGILHAIYRHTSTIGVREVKTHRYVLSRRIETRDTEFGKVRVKHSEGYGVIREKAEFEDLAGIARKEGRSLREINSAWNKNKS